MTKLEIERANAAHNLEETRIVTAQELKAMQRGPGKNLEATQFVSMDTLQSRARRQKWLLPIVVLGLLLILASLVACYRDAHPPAARTAASGNL